MHLLSNELLKHLNVNDKTKAIETIGLLTQINSFKFLATLIIFQCITKSLSDPLQSKKLDFASAASLVVLTKTTLRRGKAFDHTYTYIKSVADLLGIEEILEDTHRRRRPSSGLQQSILLEPIGHCSSLSCKDFIKLNIHVSSLDHTLTELDNRFFNSNLDLMQSDDACNPLSSNFLDSSCLSFCIIV